MTSIRPVVYLSEDSESQIVRFAQPDLPCESGGILVGYRDSNDIVISKVLSVPAESVGVSHYRRDSNVADTVLQRYLETSEDIEGYIGEWHSHPAPAGPSRLDLKTLEEIASVAEGPVALIVCAFNRNHSRHNLHIRVSCHGARGKISTKTPGRRFNSPEQINDFTR